MALQQSRVLSTLSIYSPDCLDLGFTNKQNNNANAASQSKCRKCKKDFLQFGLRSYKTCGCEE